MKCYVVYTYDNSVGICFNVVSVFFIMILLKQLCLTVRNCNC